MVWFILGWIIVGLCVVGGFIYYLVNASTEDYDPIEEELGVHVDDDGPWSLSIILLLFEVVIWPAILMIVLYMIRKKHLANQLIENEEVNTEEIES